MRYAGGKCFVYSRVEQIFLTNFFYFLLKKSFCDNGSKVVTFSASKKLFSLVGGDSLKIRATVKHDTGSSCFDADLSIKQV